MGLNPKKILLNRLKERAEEDHSNGEGSLLEEDEDGTIHSDGYDRWYEGEPVEVYIEEARLIAPGTKEICRAVMNSRHQKGSKRSYVTNRAGGS